MKIPPHIEYIDCPKCVGDHIGGVIAQGNYTREGCKRCGGEGVIRRDEKATLRTKVCIRSTEEATR